MTRRCGIRLLTPRLFRITTEIMRIFLNTLLLASFLLAGVSPACQFISGKSGLYEICASWVSKKERIPAPPIPFSLASSEKQQDDRDNSHDGVKQPPCAFCFAQSHIKQLDAATIELAAHSYIFSTSVQALQDRIVQTARRETHVPRGPPALFV